MITAAVPGDTLSPLRVLLIMTVLLLATAMASLDSSFMPLAFQDMIDDLYSSAVAAVQAFGMEQRAVAQGLVTDAGTGGGGAPFLHYCAASRTGRSMPLFFGFRWPRGPPLRSRAGVAFARRIGPVTLVLRKEALDHVIGRQLFFAVLPQFFVNFALTGHGGCVRAAKDSLQYFDVKIMDVIRAGR